jgi:hypothetical protein
VSLRLGAPGRVLSARQGGTYGRAGGGMRRRCRWLRAGWIIIGRAGPGTSWAQALNRGGHRGGVDPAVLMVSPSTDQPDEHHDEQEGKATRISQHRRAHGAVSGQSEARPKD